MKYIQRRGNGYLETVDEFTTRKEARAMLVEYRISDPTAHFHISSRACKTYLAVNHDKHKKKFVNRLICNYNY